MLTKQVYFTSIRPIKLFLRVPVAVGENSKEPEVIVKSIPTPSEALDHLHELQQYVEGQANICDPFFQALNMLHEFALLQRINSRRQLKVSNFCKKCE